DRLAVHRALGRDPDRVGCRGRDLPGLGLDLGVAARPRRHRPAGQAGRSQHGRCGAHGDRGGHGPPPPGGLRAGAGPPRPRGAVGFALVRAGQATGGMKAYLVTLGLLSVVLSWTVVHTVYMLRYARAYYGEPTGGIEFNEEEPPTYVDFAYFSFTVGMTFQVADTNITSKAIRRATLHHALLSYLFGAVLLGLIINVVATLLK